MRPDQTLSVLIADDNVDAADSLALFLTLRGHRVRVVYDGAPVIDAVEEDPPDCAILDIHMPTSGLVVARCLRARPNTAAIKLVALSGYSREQMAGLVDGEFDHWLVKSRAGPEDVERVLAAVADGRGA